MILFISYNWEPFAIGPLVPIFLIVLHNYFFTNEIPTVLITYLHALTMKWKKQSYIMQLFKNEKLLSEHYYFAWSANKSGFFLELERLWKVFLSLEKCLQSLAKTLSFSVKNQKLSQLLSVSLIAIYKSLNAGANNPGHLFGQVCRRSPQFRGFQQQGRIFLRN